MFWIGCTRLGSWGDVGHYWSYRADIKESLGLWWDGVVYEKVLDGFDFSNGFATDVFDVFSES